MHYRIMEVEQRKKPGSALRQNPRGTASVGRSVVSQLQTGLLATQAARGNRYVQRMVARIRDEQNNTEIQPAQTNLEDTQGNEHENRTGLPDQLKLGIEQLSGYSLDDVRVHYNSPKPAQFQALAYTQSTDIYVARGQERHLPHEAWHVVQQAQGRVGPTIQLEDGVPVNDDERLEHEADVMGAKTLSMKRLLWEVKEKRQSITRAIQKKDIPTIQRISEEDARQANFIIKPSALRHGYTEEMLIAIMQHRCNEIHEGERQSMLIGQGTEEEYGKWGQILYHCHRRNGIYEITVFHAHGQGRMG